MIGCNTEALPLSEYGSFIRVEPYPRPRPAADEAECGALCDELLEVLFAERNMVAAFNLPYPEKRKIVREYMNRRFPAPVPERFLAAQDKLFWTETLRRGVEEIDGLRYKEGIAVYAGDITRLNADAIVNSASGELTGCYIPLHNCIDNIIHSRAAFSFGKTVRRLFARRDARKARAARKSPPPTICPAVTCCIPSARGLRSASAKRKETC